jgi:tetratricopeptide (TPR) repeat protein
MGLEAWETLEDLPAESKNNQRVLELRLECLCHEKEWQKASILGESITATLPQSALARFWLAVARCQLGDVELARDALGRAIELDSSLRERVINEPLLEAIW